MKVTNTEQRVLDVLFQRNAISAYQISSEADVSRGIIYSILSSLESKGLIITIPGKTKLFTLNSYEEIDKIVNKEVQELQKFTQKVKTYEETKTEKISPVTVEKGARSFWKLVQQVPSPKKYFYTIKYTSDYSAKSIETVEHCNANHIAYKSLTRVGDDTKFNLKKWFTHTKHIKELDNSGVAIFFQDDNDCVISLINSGEIIRIRDPAFVKVFRTLYERYYETQDILKL